MDWPLLMSPNRLTVSPSGHVEFAAPQAFEAVRGPFQKDADRVIYSSAFRRLQDKTQVQPFPVTDYLRTRLTHSLEVASVGRSLGTYIGRDVLARHGRLHCAGYDLGQEDFGAAVAAACLAHDIGNPPFGHAGEDAIRQWFRGEGKELVDGRLGTAELGDLENFEGNAQGFRILTRLQVWRERGGLRLSAATLGTFSKYPGACTAMSAVGARGKFGFFQAERDSFAAIAAELGLTAHGHDAWARHPLAYLVEAADDICYGIVDLEDGVKAGKIKFADAESLLTPIAGNTLAHYGDIAEEMDRIGYLRAKAIGALTDEVKQVFLDNEAPILAGDYEGALIDRVTCRDRLGAIADVCRQRLFHDAAKLEAELGGFEVVHGLLRVFAPAVAEYQDCDGDVSRMTPRHRRLIHLLPGAAAAGQSYYAQLLRLTDYVSGMTDRFAVSQFRRLTGHGIG